MQARANGKSEAVACEEPPGSSLPVRFGMESLRAESEQGNYTARLAPVDSSLLINSAQEIFRRFNLPAACKKNPVEPPALRARLPASDREAAAQLTHLRGDRLSPCRAVC